MQHCNNIVVCACGCGQTFPQHDKWGRMRHYKNGHWNRGKIVSEETRKKLSLRKSNENSPLWKGDKVTCTPLHKWVRRHFWKTELCMMCMHVPPYDLANVTGIYNRDFKNWRYYCRKCHMISDGRLDKLRRIKKHPAL